MNEFTPLRVIEAEGSKIGLTICTLCGATLLMASQLREVKHHD